MMNNPSRLLCCLFFFALCGTANAAQIVATWNGGGDGVNYNDPTNWDIGVVPINGGGDTYEVVIPGGQNVQFSGLGAGNIVDRLELGNGSKLTAIGSTDLTTTNGAEIDNGILEVLNGGQLILTAPIYENSNNFSEAIFTARDGSTLDLSSLTSITLNTGSSWTKTIVADSSAINLSNVTSIGTGTGAALLDVTVMGSGTIDLSSLTSINTQANNSADRVRFFYEGTGPYQLPVETAVNTEFRLPGAATLKSTESDVAHRCRA